jgi:ATP synthase mitochondrial F1 complex assembly factor 1
MAHTQRALRNLVASPPRLLLRAAGQQRRWARVHDVRPLAAPQHHAHTDADVLARYRDRLDAKAAREGLAGVDALREAYAERIRDARARDASDAAVNAALHAHRHQPEPQSIPQRPPPPPPTTPSSTGPQPLSTILDLEKARTLPVKDLTAVWRLRHAADPKSLAAVIPAATYARMEALARQHPQFVLPVPDTRSAAAPDGAPAGASPAAELHFLQWTFHTRPEDGTTTSTVLFTQLAEYKLRGEWAAAHTSVTHHSELAGEKGVVLMAGSVVDGRGVGVEEARWLAMCLQRFYSGGERSEERRRLLEWFSAGDERFSVEALLDEAQRFG